ncbi:hypothetical protein OS493_028243 [Desmophyllum pertusum]|uniref:PID domain-containing protein n=1 Tax=Desmophyllum pertusum TaxID=174260 RepID=A0A9W9YKD0_9CNID|nr:hypothetical protein OS493_028243 [Desmophyllum pertusum]
MAYSALRNRFSRRAKGIVETITPVIYLGSVQILCPVGEGICGSIEEIVENCRIKLKDNLLPKQTLQVKDDSFELSRAGEEDQGTKTVYKFSRIIYCGVDGKRRKILVFNYHHGEGEERDTYLTQAFMCENKSAAKQLAITVAEFFQKVKFVGGQEVDEHENEEPQLKTEKGDRNNTKNSISESEIQLQNITSSSLA